jgi:MipA family protein
MKQVPFTLLMAIFLFFPISLGAYDVDGSAGFLLSIEPKYEGSDELEVEPLPLLDISLGKMAFLDSERGLGVYLLRNRMLEFGGSLGYYESREEEDSDKLKGFSEVDDGIDARIFAKFKLNEAALFFQIRNDLSSNHDGTIFDFGASYRFKPFRFANLDVKLSTTFADTNYMDTYFSVSQAQLTASGLLPTGVPFNATGGWKDIRLGSNLSVEINRRWRATWVIGYKRLTRAAAFSPLVRGIGSEDQLKIGIGVSYQFFSGAVRF